MAELECFPVCFFPLYQAGSWRETDSTHKGFHQRVFRHKIVFRSTHEVKGPLRNVKRGKQQHEADVSLKQMTLKGLVEG